MSEQSPAILPLIALALFVGAQAWDRVRSYEWPAYSATACEMRGKYLGRNDESRPEWEYWEKCYE